MKTILLKIFLLLLLNGLVSNSVAQNWQLISSNDTSWFYEINVFGKALKSIWVNSITNTIDDTTFFLNKNINPSGNGLFINNTNGFFGKYYTKSGTLHSFVNANGDNVIFDMSKQLGDTFLFCNTNNETYKAIVSKDSQDTNLLNNDSIKEFSIFKVDTAWHGLLRIVCSKNNGLLSTPWLYNFPQDVYAKKRLDKNLQFLNYNLHNLSQQYNPGNFWIKTTSYIYEDISTNFIINNYGIVQDSILNHSNYLNGIIAQVLTRGKVKQEIPYFDPATQMLNKNVVDSFYAYIHTDTIYPSQEVIKLNTLYDPQVSNYLFDSNTIKANGDMWHCTITDTSCVPILNIGLLNSPIWHYWNFNVSNDSFKEVHTVSGVYKYEGKNYFYGLNFNDWSINQTNNNSPLSASSSNGRLLYFNINSCQFGNYVSIYPESIYSTSKPKSKLSIAPNPCTVFCTVNINVAMRDNFTLNIYNTLGQKLFTTTMHLQNGESNIDIPVSNLPQGVYTITVSSPTNSYSQLMIKQ
jgi:hypothetical protein